jgi:hypothetical protein
MHFDFAHGRAGRACTFAQDFVLQAGLGGDDAGLFGVLGEVCLVVFKSFRIQEKSFQRHE